MLPTPPEEMSARLPTVTLTPTLMISNPGPGTATVTLDVFTDRMFGGNPLAVLPDAAGLTTEQMQAIDAAAERLDWMRLTESDYEMAMAIHEMESFARGEGYYAGLEAPVRRAQLDWLAELYDQFYPSLRIFLFDARQVYSSPVTVFGPKMAVIYMGRHYIAFRDRDRVRTVTRHFDWLVREASVSAREVPGYLDRLRALVR